MLDAPHLMYFLGLIVIAAPALLIGLLGLTTLVERPLSEERVGRAVQWTVIVGLTGSLCILALMLVTGERRVPIELGSWVHIDHFHFMVKFEFDRLSVPFVILSFVLCGTIGAFANKYMHREPGFNRFFFLYAIFLGGMVCASLAGTIETLFAGWELVGLSSALLVAFYQERTAPVNNGYQIWIVYRISDAALLTASVLLHHLRGEGDFDKLLGINPWPDGATVITPEQAILVGVLILIAAAGKSALVPFSGWLPRAMEGPTPSSAVFYGALSVHLGAYLLLRMSPLLDISPVLRGMVITIGVATVLFATVTGRVQTDVKCALSYASLTQVGLIVVEIGLGLEYLALIHILGHACLRTLQFLRAPTLLYDYRNMEDALGQRIVLHQLAPQERRPSARSMWWYRFALERGYLDALLKLAIVRPFQQVFALCDAAEQRWTEWLEGPAQKPATASPASQEELQ